jgi:hypothetical protein
LSNKWQVGPVKLVNGDDAFIDAINEGQEGYRYTGRMKLYNQWTATGWDDTGRRMYSEIDSPGNLAPPPKKKVRIQTLLVVYGNGKTCNFGYSDRERAVIEAKRRGFALIEIDREVEEGEGL